MDNPQASFEALLRMMMNGEDSMNQKEAERVFTETTNTQPNEIYQALLQVGITNAHEDLRAFALINLRRTIISKQQEWYQLSLQTRALIKNEVLAAIEREKSHVIRGHLRELATALAEYLLDEDNNEGDERWNELLPWILKMIDSKNEGLMEAGFLMLGQLTLYLEEWLANPLTNFTAATAVVNVGLQHPDLKVAQAALTTLNSFVFNFAGTKFFKQELRKLIQPMLNLLARSLAGTTEQADTTLSIFVELLEQDSSYLKPAVELVAEVMIKIVHTPTLQDTTKQLALEFLVQYVENKPLLFEKIPWFLKSFLDTILHLMLKIEDTDLAEWNTQTEEDDANEVETSDIAQVALDRASQAMGGEFLVPLLFSYFPGFLAHEDWKYRQAALMAISMVGEGSFAILSPELPKIIELILPFFQDKHPRVRWAAAHTAGQLAEDFATAFQKKSHRTILPALASLLQDSQNPKIQAHTLVSLVKFCLKFDRVLIQPYLDSLLTAVMGLLQSTNVEVQRQAVSAIGAISGCAKEGFNPYYSSFAPLLLRIIREGTGKEHRLFRAKAIECLSIVGCSVGKDVFKGDSYAMMDVLSTIPFSDDIDDPLHQAVLQAWLRISVCLGDEFIPYLKYVMPILIKAANTNTPIQYSEDKDAFTDKQGWDVVPVGNMVGEKTYHKISRIAVHTSTLEEKYAACSNIFHYTKEVGLNFLPFVKEVAVLMVPLFSYYHHDGVRISSVSTMPHLLKVAKKQFQQTGSAVDLQFLNELFDFIFPEILKAIRQEPDKEVVGISLTAVGECVSVMDRECFPTSFVPQVVLLVRDYAVKLHKQRAQYEEKEEGEEFHAQVIRSNELQKCDLVFNELAEVLGALVRAHPNVFLASFDELTPILIELSKSTAAVSEQQMTITIFDDIVANTGGALAQPVWEHFVPLLFQHLHSTEDELRRVSAYGLGVCCQFGGPPFEPFIGKALEFLVNSINQSRIRSREALIATDSAVSAVGKIIEFSAHILGTRLAQVFQMFLSWLPLIHDELEAKETHHRLLRFLDQQNPAILGPNWANFPKILAVFTHISDDNDLISEEGVVHFFGLLKQLPPEVVSAAISTLTPELKAKFFSLQAK